MTKKKMARLKKRYTQKNLRNRNIRFSIFYLILLAAIGFGLYKLYVYVDDFLVSYEKAQSRYVVEDMAAMFVEKRFDEVFEYEDQSKLSGETKEDYVEYLEKLTEVANIEYKEVPSTDSNERVFKVMSNGKSFASFTIQKSGEIADANLFGLIKDVELYVPGTVTTDILQPIAYQVVLPDDCTLLINGEEAKEEYIVSSGEETWATGRLPEGYPDYTLTTYRFTLALGVPTLSAFDANGNELTLREINQDSYRFDFDIRDQELKPIHEARAVEAAQAVCKYMSKNTYQSAVLEYMVDGSSAEESIREADVYWIKKADRYSFENIKTENYVLFSDTVFSCDVYLDYVTETKNNVETYETARRFFFTLTDGEWLIYHYENI